MLKNGDVLDEKYWIRKQIGQGGMSKVYLAENKMADTLWAIKEVQKRGYIDQFAVAQSLITEKEILKGLRQRGIVSVTDVMETTQCLYLVMEYIDGETLEKCIQRNGRIRTEAALEYAMQICELLGYLHSRKMPIIYQDLKPTNLMKRKDGSIVLIDFGTARKYGKEEKKRVLCLGTRGYAAPEQYKGKSMGAATDIYALGMLLLYMLTGLNPVKDEKAARQEYTIKCQKYHIPKKIIRVIGKCIQMEPHKRYQSCAELFEELLGCEENTGMQRIMPAIERRYHRKRNIEKLEHQMRTIGMYAVNGVMQYQIGEDWGDIILPLDQAQKDWMINTKRAEVRFINECKIKIEKDISYAFDRKNFL